MALKQDPFEGQFTPGDIKALGRADKQVPSADEEQQDKEAKPAAKKAVKRFAEVVPASKPDQIVVDPVIKGINEEFTRKSDTVVVLNGRMNPVTKGHEENVNGMHQLAKEHDADHLVVATHSHDEKTVGSGNKNPLSPEQKLKHLTRAFPGTNVTTTSKEKPSIFHQMADLHKRGYKHVILAAGEDRTEDYERIKKYNGKTEGDNGKPLSHGYYKFDTINVQSTGERKPGISGTDMRKYAEAGDFDSFKKNLPTAIRKNTTHAKDIFADVRNGMKLNESLTAKTQAALLEKAFASGVKPSVIQEVYKRGVHDWNEDSKQTVEQHAFARVNSFIACGAAYRMDSDLRDLDEAVDMQTRLKRKVNMAMYRRKIERAREIAMQRFARNKNLRARAFKIARNTLRKRLGGARGANYAKLSTAQKIAVDKLLDKRQKQIKNIANKITARVKRDEAGRLAGQRTSTAKSAIVASYEPKPLSTIVEVFGISSKTKGHIMNVASDVSDTPGHWDHKAQKFTDAGHKELSRRLGGNEKHIKYAKSLTSKDYEGVNEATYQGKKVPLNKPMKGDVKKSKVYVDPDGDGKAKKVNFGDKNMTIKKNIPARRASFRARHNCDEPGPKDKARYWSCKAW